MNLRNFFRGKQNVPFESAMAEYLYRQAPNRDEQMRAATTLEQAHTVNIPGERGLAQSLQPKRDHWMLSAIRDFQNMWNKRNPQNQRDILSPREASSIQSLAEGYDRAHREAQETGRTPGERKG